MANILDQLQATIFDRKRHPRPDSYTNKLFEAGRGRIAQKVGEEATVSYTHLTLPTTERV